MEDRAYRNALKRRDELKKELVEVEHFIEMYQQFMNYHAGPMGDGGPLRSSVSVRPSMRTRRRMSREEMAPIIKDVLIEHGRPMTRGPLVEALAAKNIPIAGTDPSKNMGTIMWRLRGRFINIEGEGYWPKDVSCDAVGYDPEESENETEMARLLD